MYTLQLHLKHPLANLKKKSKKLFFRATAFQRLTKPDEDTADSQRLTISFDSEPTFPYLPLAMWQLES